MILSILPLLNDLLFKKSHLLFFLRVISSAQNHHTGDTPKNHSSFILLPLPAGPSWWAPCILWGSLTLQTPIARLLWALTSCGALWTQRKESDLPCTYDLTHQYGPHIAVTHWNGAKPSGSPELLFKHLRFWATSREPGFLKATQVICWTG